MEELWLLIRCRSRTLPIGETMDISVGVIEYPEIWIMLFSTSILKFLLIDTLFLIIGSGSSDALQESSSSRNGSGGMKQ